MISTSRHRKVCGTLNALYYKLLKFPGTLRQSLSNLRFHNLSSLRPYEVTEVTLMMLMEKSKRLKTTEIY